MADKFRGVAVGGKLATDVQTGTSTTSAACELRVTDGAFPDETALINAIEAIKMHVIKDTFPLS